MFLSRLVISFAVHMFFNFPDKVHVKVRVISSLNCVPRALEAYVLLAMRVSYGKGKLN